MSPFSALSDLLTLNGVLTKFYLLDWSHIKTISFEAISCRQLDMVHCSIMWINSNCDLCIAPMLSITLLVYH